MAVMAALSTYSSCLVVTLEVGLTGLQRRAQGVIFETEPEKKHSSRYRKRVGFKVCAHARGRAQAYICMCICVENGLSAELFILVCAYC